MDRYVADQLLTMSGDNLDPIANGVVDVENGRVAWSGPASEAPERDGASTHYISGIMMPGLVNTHAHSPMVVLRGMGEGLPVDHWLREVMWPREAKVTEHDVASAMRMGGIELLLNGITTSVEMYFHPQSVAEAVDEIGLRCLVAAAVIDQEQLDRFGSWESQIERVMELRDKWASHDRIDVAFGPHDPTLPVRCLRRIAAAASETDMLVHMHLAESRADVAAIEELVGTTAPAYLESIGMFEPAFLAAHAVWLTDEDIDTLARNNIAVAHCPCSNAKHASGIARVDDMVGSSIRVGIATDGPASHQRLDLFEEMRTAIRLARVSTGNAETFPARRALRMVTADAADAMGRPDLGRLEVGSWADMIAIDESAPALNPVIPDEDDPVSRIVWSGSPSSISAVWVAGEKLVDGGVPTRVDVSQLVADARATAVRLAK